LPQQDFIAGETDAQTVIPPARRPKVSRQAKNVLSEALMERSDRLMIPPNASGVNPI
jgi:hypothetical protein